MVATTAVPAHRLTDRMLTAGSDTGSRDLEMSATAAHHRDRHPSAEESMETIKKAIREMPPLHEMKNLNWAAAIGFLFGGIGLAVYFRSVIDGVVPIAIMVVAIIAASVVGSDLTVFGWLAGAIIASLYGYYRAQTSNENLAAGAPVSIETA
jgi:hypothetical protein